jgi:amylosucrase
MSGMSPAPPGPSPDRARALLVSLLPSVRARSVAALGEVEGEAVAARLEQHYVDLVEPLAQLYGSTTALTPLVTDLVDQAVDAALARPTPLRALDRRREIDPGWFQRSRTIGYVCYADRFAGDLAGVRSRLDYLAELGISYLHLMPLLQPRDGPDDGGYAVADYRRVDPRLGTLAELEGLAGDLHDRGMSLCIDLVLNHTAAEHPWARAAQEGDPTYRAYYRTFPDRTEPDRYEATLPEVFPDTSPGSFTHVEGLGWVWTTFESYQWDLDWSNHEVFAAMLNTTLFLANHGVDVLRLDAAPFLWKRVGTDCQNQPEVHLILQALRALVSVAAPGVAFKAEAIVSPDELVRYLGAHDEYRPECELGYHNQLMVQLWSSLATRDAGLARAALARMRSIPPGTSWVTYLRCHDDVGWAIADEDAYAVGWDPHAHRSFLSDFYSGAHPGSFARGQVFQHNPRTGDRRISGSTAALCGLQDARVAGDEEQVQVGVRRLLLLHAVVYSFGGIPLVWMGDELGLGNDDGWARDPEHAGDNRWLHRPVMDWSVADRRHRPGTVEARVFAGLRALATTRTSLLALRSGNGTEVLDAGDPHVLAYLRRHERGPSFLGLANFSDDPATASPDVLDRLGTGARRVVLAADGVSTQGPGVRLPAWGWAWVTDR